MRSASGKWTKSTCDFTGKQFAQLRAKKEPRANFPKWAMAQLKQNAIDVYNPSHVTHPSRKQISEPSFTRWKTSQRIAGMPEHSLRIRFSANVSKAEKVRSLIYRRMNLL
jgi:hypothetical protein